MSNKPQIDVSQLKRQIDKGKSLNEVVMSLGKANRLFSKWLMRTV